jgi:methionyl aminopeptidase
MPVNLKSKDEIAIMAEAGRILAQVILDLCSKVEPGIQTKELDKLAEELILKNGARPGFKGYMGYPASICTSVNNQVVHGIPGKYRLKEGDIISLDIGLVYKGYWADAGVTVPVGNIQPRARKLIDATRRALYAGIAKAVPGNRLGDISHAIQSYVESSGFSVVRDFCGHGVGREMHEDPQVPNYGMPGQGVLLQPGMTLAIEPMVNEGDWRVKVLDDNWTVVTADGKLSAYFEHTITITEDGPIILTSLDGNV